MSGINNTLRRTPKADGFRSRRPEEALRSRVEPLEQRLLMAVNPIINEFMASNDNTIDDVDGDSSDWIEIYNPGDANFDLNGYFLTDSVDTWTIPAVTISPGGYLVIFASGKDRFNPAQELHTNFQISASSGYLGLLAPDGTTIISEYNYPTQLTDVSYGQAVQEQITRLINTNAAVKVLVPTSGALGTTWTTQSFNDASWTTGTTGVGFDLNTPPPPIPGFTVKMVDVDVGIGNIPTATRILDGNTSGYSVSFNGSLDYPVVNLGPGGDFFPDQPLPNGLNETEFYALRATAKVFIPSGTWTFDLGSDDGMKMTLIPDAGFAGVTFTNKYNENAAGFPGAVPPNVLVYSAPRGHAHTGGAVTIPAGGFRGQIIVDFYEDGGGDDMELSFASSLQLGFNAGIFVPVGNAALPGVEVTTSATAPPNYLPLIRTNTQAGMLNNNASALMRLNFTVENPADFDMLKLRMKYDDGFVAYVNGVKVAERNAPLTTSWNSVASNPHPDADAFIYEDINIPLSTLVAGVNVLAIQGLNASPGDDDFLIYPELEGVKILSSNPRYFDTPTPGAANNTSTLVGVVGDTHFNVDRGFYNSPFLLDITADTPDAEIRYTLNGTAPTSTSGTVYTGPILIDKTTTIRAQAYKPGFISSNIDTQTYIFTSDVITQSSNGAPPPGWPSSWTPNVTDYGMDPDIVNSPAYNPTIQNDLKTLPSISLVMNLNDLFGPTGIYSNPGGDGRVWERPGSIELICPPGNSEFVCAESSGQGFQIDGGIRLRGGFSRSTDNPKHAFRFFFRDEYGDGKLNFPMFGPDGAQSFDGFDLRTFQNYSWSFQNDSRGIFLRDQLARDAQLAMGQPGKRGEYYHLYINGQYWGLFNTDERSEASYAASYFGGTADEYDVIKPSPDNGYNVYPTDGNMNAWTDFWNQAVAIGNITDQNLSNEAYMRIQGKNPDGTRNLDYPVQLDADNLIDYMLLTFYGGNLDAPLSWFLGNGSPNNFFATRNRNGEEGWKSYVHDAEHTLLNLNEDRTGPFANPATPPALGKSNPQFIFEFLARNDEFKLRVADRIRKWFFNDGVLTPSKFTELFNIRKAEIDRAVVGESARWGDAKRAVPFNRDVTWVSAINDVLSNYIPFRTTNVVNQLSADGFNSTGAPNFSQYGGTINPGFNLTITNPGGAGTIYYTLDGSDPRRFGGGVSSTAAVYSGPITLNQTTEVKARVLLADGVTWTALTETILRLNLSALRVTELNYNPIAPVGGGFVSQDYEFIELQNTGAVPINPVGASFSNGITFDFPSMVIAPGGKIILVRNHVAFEGRYGPGLPIAGTFLGALNDGGEQLTLSLGSSVVFDFTYDDDWYPITDGGGYTLVALNPAQPPAAFSTKAGWKAGDTVNGTPGGNDTGPTPGIVVINEVMSNPTTPNSDWIELRNTTALPVNVGGWWVSNDPLNLKKYQIASGTTIGVGVNGFLVLTESAHFGNAGAAVPFSISDLGADIFLSNNGVGGNLGGYREHVDFGASAPGVTFGAYTKSTGGVDFVAMSTPTQGAANALPQFGPVVIGEIMYNPIGTGHEFIELQNLTGASFSLYDAANANGWKFDEGVDFTFGPGAAVPANGYALIVGIDPALFRSTYSIPAGVPIFGPWVGALDDSGENVKLSKPGTPVSTPQGPVVPYIIEDQVHYNDNLPWPADADGLGPSLTRAPASAYGNDAGNWTGGPFGGTPGGVFSPPANPYALIATATGTTTVTLSWTDFSGAETGFKVERSTDNVNFTQIGQTALNQTTYNDSNLTQGTRYFYRVRAYNNAGNSSFSNKASALTQSTNTITLIGTPAGGSSDPFTDSWKYYQTEAAAPANDGAGRDWKNRQYDETPAGWAGPSPGLLYVEPSGLTATKSTALQLGGLTNGTDPVTPTFYFRKHFNLSVAPAAVTSLVLQAYVDDIARIYINGTKVLDLGFTDGAVLAHTTYGNSVGGRLVDNAQLEAFTLPPAALSTLLPGDNVIAVEVHQVGNTSSDIVWGATLVATVSASATLVTPDILDVTPDPRPNSVDTMTITFNQPVTGLDLTDLTLSRNGGPNLLSGVQTLSSSDGGTTWTLGNLRPLTWVAGNYTLVLLAGNSGIAGTASGNPIGPDALDTFTVTTTSIQGTSGSDNFHVRVNGSMFEVFQTIPPTGSPTYSVPVSEISSLTIAGDTGNDTLEIGSTIPFEPVFSGGAGTDRLMLAVGNRTLAGDLLASGVEDLIVSGTSQVTFAVPQHLSALTVNNTARVTLAPGTGQLLDISALTLAATAFLNLGDGDMIVHAANSTARQQMLNLITSRIRASRESSPRWSGPGISSTLGASDRLVSIGAIPNNVGAGGSALYTTFAGQAVDVNSVLVKTTYLGDRNLDGDVDADDYAGIDAGYAQGLTGYYNGDFDFSGGKPDADDYFLIDRSYSGQGAPLGAQTVIAPAAAAASVEVDETAVVTVSETKDVKAGTFSSGPAVKVKQAKRVAVKGVVEAAPVAKKKKRWMRRGFDF